LDLLRPSTWSRFFEEESIDAILAEHVWEHLTQEQGMEAARTCYRFLKPGGYVRLAVPDGFHPDPHYIEQVRIGGTGPAAWDHKVLYDFQSISTVFARAGFEVKLLEYFNERGAFHAVDWDPDEGLIHRSRRFDRRNRDKPLTYTSLIIDAMKPVAEDREDFA